ncbi:MAG TPA: hypothetical protein VGX03_25480 [Candidatus Binatia bacterium]|jgi:hypothetical protein|nr:hypothetical protein [Candidatus Binatia bacterium]
MKKTTTGIPTLYNNRRYRSRLEARWAAFFDLVGWQYEYEPFDLKGWIPDFLLHGAKHDVLVEVKPYTELIQFPVRQYDTALESSEVRYSLLLLGPLITSGWSSELPIIGFCCTRTRYWGEAIVERLEDLGDGRGWPSRNPKDLIGIYPSGAGEFAYDLITDLSPDLQGSLSYKEVCSWWSEAGNRVQWKAPA